MSRKTSDENPPESVPEYEDRLAAADAAIKRGLAAGATEVEFFIRARHVHELSLDGDLIDVRDLSESGAGVRLRKDGRIGTASAQDLTRLDALVDEALSNTRSGRAVPEGVAQSFPAPARLSSAPATTRPPPNFELSRLEDILAAAHDVFASIPSISYHEMSARWVERDMTIVNNHGLSVRDRQPSHKVAFQVRASRGTTHRTASDSWVADAPPPAAAGRDIIAGAVQRALDALAVETESMTHERIVMAPGPASQVVGMIAPNLAAKPRGAAATRLSDRLGESVMSASVSLHNDATASHALLRRHFDDEGMRARAVPLIEHGVLRQLTYDHATAAQHGVGATGTSTRDGLSGAISSVPRALTMAAGDHALDELLEALDDGVFVTEPMLGSFTANATTGAFSLSLPFAFRVRGGRIVHALPPTTVGGNAYDVLTKVEAIGRDKQAYAPAYMPALLVGGVTCAS